MKFVPESASRADWPRIVAQAVNAVQRIIDTGTAFRPRSEPANPVEGQIYYDDATHKLRCWDGSAWQNLF